MKFISSLISALILLVFLSAMSCGNEPDQSRKDDERQNPETNASLPRRINDFSRDLYRTATDVEDASDNLLLSPLSIHTAFTMTFAGTDGDDRRKMGKALHIDPDDNRLNQRYHQLINALQTNGSGIRMNVGNAIRTAPNTSVSPSYVDEMTRFFSANVSSLTGDPSADAEKLNQWVSEQTGGAIDQLITPGDLRQALFVLLNAVHFKGTWTAPFDKDDTQKEPFHRSDGTKTTVPMMQRTGHYAMTKVGENGKAIRLPYGKEERYGMVVFLPDREQKAGTFFTTIYESSRDKWNTWFNELNGEKTRVRLSFPRFDMTFGTTPLTPYLNRLGVPLRNVNLGRMGVGSVQRLHSLHKATITVNEEGTEAAGATGVVGVTSVPPSITVNRPFFFLIRDRKTGTILFMGTVFNPAD